jgi:hypothetical protein
MWTVGNRVTVDGKAGRIYAIDHDWAGLILDETAHRSNPPIFWAKFDELKEA